MKITNLSIIFILIASCFIVLLDRKMDNIQVISNKQVMYKQALDNAVDDAVVSLVEVDSARNLELNRDSCLQNFYQSLYAGFGILTDNRLQEELKRYIPVILLTDEDGFYINYHEVFQTEEDFQSIQQWTEKRPYSYEDDKRIYSFFLGEKKDYIRVYDKGTKERMEGTIEDVQNFYGETFFDGNLDLIRRNSIIDSIEMQMIYYINKYNTIARKNGITYHFYLPKIEDDDWNRTIDDISLFVLFQGYPYGTPLLGYFNRYAYGGARIKKADIYFMEENNGVLYYHRGNCILLKIKTVAFSTKKECALCGARPCAECN
jgi:hypothetical protein